MKPSQKRLVVVTSLIVSSAVAAHAQSRRWIYAEVAGRADVVTGFKRDAIARGWKVVCEQTIGPGLTLRVRIPAGTPEADLESYSGDIRDMRPYSVGFIYPGMPTSAPFCAPPENARAWVRDDRARHPPAVSDVPLQAARCGLKSDQLVWRKDAEGYWRADITPNGKLGAPFFQSMKCFLDWAQQSGVRIGFISEPPPPPKPKP